MTTPNKPRLRLWVKWLLDPVNKQARGQLYVDDAHCCLGGGCEVYKAETGQGEWMNSTFVVGGVKSDLVMPWTVSDWFGLESADPMLRVDDHLVVAATALNDSKKWTFPQIAEAITKTYKLDEPDEVAQP